MFRIGGAGRGGADHGKPAGNRGNLGNSTSECPKMIFLGHYVSEHVENGPFIDDLPVENGDFPHPCWLTGLQI